MQRSERTFAKSATLTLVQDLAQTLRDSNSASVEFLKIEVETGITFAEIAKHSRDAQKTARNRKNARLAYDTVLRYVGRVSLTSAEVEALSSRMAYLKNRLQILGESF